MCAFALNTLPLPWTWINASECWNWNIMTCSQLFQPFKYNIFFSNVKTYCALKAHEIFFIRVCAGVTCLADGGQRDTMIHAESSCTKKNSLNAGKGLITFIRSQLQILIYFFSICRWSPSLAVTALHAALIMFVHKLEWVVGARNKAFHSLCRQFEL